MADASTAKWWTVDTNRALQETLILYPFTPNATAHLLEELELAGGFSTLDINGQGSLVDSLNISDVTIIDV